MTLFSWQMSRPPFLFSFKASRSYTLWTCVYFIIAWQCAFAYWLREYMSYSSHSNSYKLPYKNIKVAETSAHIRSYSRAADICAASKTFKTKFIAKICVHLRSYGGRDAFKIPHAQPDISYNWIFNYTQARTRLHALISCFTPSHRALFIYLFWLPFIECNSLLNETEHHHYIAVIGASAHNI